MTREAKLRSHREFQRKVDVADLHYLAESGFVARGDTGPQQDAPQNWVVWHFTHKDNLQGIVDDNALLPSTMKAPAVNVANTGIKGRRATIRVRPDGTYPEATVAQHVPFYIAAKSPMLYSISKGHEEYRGGTADLVFLGAVLGDIAASGLTWCVSNGNAAVAFTEFSRQLPTLGSFVDFPLLQQRIWKNVPEDMNRMSRRAAELLVLGPVPLSLISMVAAKTEPVVTRAQAQMSAVGGVRQYGEFRELYY
jgi:hypothetical protein